MGLPARGPGHEGGGVAGCAEATARPEPPRGARLRGRAGGGGPGGGAAGFGLFARAARFAAKEALLKALGTGSAHGISFLQVEVIRQDGGSAALSLTGSAAAEARRRGVRHVHLSLSHQPGLAAAVVILEG